MLHNLRLSDLDVAIIDFLWTWKLATTSMLGLRFSADTKSIAIYQRLMRLARAQLIAVTSDQAGKCFAWVLTNTGFTIAKRNLGQLAEVGYKSEKQLHDLLVTAIHLGDNIWAEETGLETFTEQQMRRYEIEYYPSWVPPTTRHRPDGYWLVQGKAEKPRVVALEVELSRKLDSDYQAVREFYMAWKRIYRVIWFVPKAKDAKRLAKKFAEEPGVEQCYHNFVLLGDFLKSGWQSPITLGPDQGMCVAELLYDKPMTWQKPVTGMLLLNGAKAPHKSASYKLWNLSEFCH
jgi:hypothetical protein